MSAKTYIGITGVTSQEESSKLLDVFTTVNHNNLTKHTIMAGVLLTNDTLSGIKSSNKRYPDFSDVKSIFSVIKNKALAMIHYETSNPDKLAEQVSQIFEEFYDLNLCKAIQLNMAKPNPNEVKKIKNKFPQLKIVFQLRPEIINSLSYQEIANIINEYGDSLSYILIDPSCGTGLEFDPKKSLELYNFLTRNFPKITFGFAGGLNGTNLKEKIIPIINSIGNSNFCIDVESGVRNIQDELDFSKVEAYLRSAYSILK